MRKTVGGAKLLLIRESRPIDVSPESVPPVLVDLQPVRNPALVLLRDRLVSKPDPVKNFRDKNSRHERRS